jgi:hypothetical protein
MSGDGREFPPRAGPFDLGLAGISGRPRALPATSCGMSAGCGVVLTDTRRDVRGWRRSRASRRLSRPRRCRTQRIAPREPIPHPVRPQTVRRVRVRAPSPRPRCPPLASPARPVGYGRMNVMALLDRDDSVLVVVDAQPGFLAAEADRAVERMAWLVAVAAPGRRPPGRSKASRGREGQSTRAAHSTTTSEARRGGPLPRTMACCLGPWAPPPSAARARPAASVWRLLGLS